MLVGVQFFCVTAILVTGPVIAAHWGTLGLEVIGVVLGGWALSTMSIRNLQILPDLRPDQMLVTRGPYRMIRHPMYSALLLAMLALILEEFTYARLGLWLALCGVLWIKLTYEERLLADRFPSYREYQRRTTRLLPFVF